MIKNGCGQSGDRTLKSTASEERTDAIITGLLRENFEQNSTSSDEDLADILVDLGKKKRVLNVLMESLMCLM